MAMPFSDEDLKPAVEKVLSKVEPTLALDGGGIKLIDIKNGVISGCDPKDPLWQIEFTSSDYNTKTKWLNLYNTILYIYD